MMRTLNARRLFSKVSLVKICFFALLPLMFGAAPALTLSPFNILYNDNVTGRYVYVSDLEGNRIVDFSNAGYKGGGVAIPNISGLPTVNVSLDGSPGCVSEQDNTACIQNAIDTVSGYIPNADGLRGVVKLAAGNYTLTSPWTPENPVTNLLAVSTSGVILAGGGSGNTTLTVTGSTPPTGSAELSVIEMGGNKPATLLWNNTGVVSIASIENQYIPVGATEFRVKTGGYVPAVGDNIIIVVPTNDYWASFANYGGVTPPGTATDFLWGNGGAMNIPGGSVTSTRKVGDIKYNRTVQEVVNNAGSYGVRLNAPIFASINNGATSPYGAPFTATTVTDTTNPITTDGAYVYPFNKAGAEYQNNIGVQALRIEIDSVDCPSNCVSQEYATHGVRIRQADDVWVDDVIVSGYRLSAFSTLSASQVTVSNAQALNANPSLPPIGGRAYAFSADAGSNLILFDTCSAVMPRHGFVTGESTTSGIVFLNGSTVQNHLSSEGHQHWSQGILFDHLSLTNDTSGIGTARFFNRSDSGNSHGWSAVNSVMWGTNLDNTARIVVQKPPSAQNYGMNFTPGLKITGEAWCTGTPCVEASGSPGYFENNGSSNSSLPSLYTSQLTERQTVGGLPPSVPVNLTVSLNGSNKPVLSWDNLMGLGQGVKNFAIERSTDGGTTYSTLTTTLSPLSTSYTDNKGTINSMYRMYATKDITKGTTTTTVRSAYSSPAPIAGRYVKLVMNTTSGQINGGNVNLNQFLVFAKSSTTRILPASVVVYQNTITTTTRPSGNPKRYSCSSNGVGCAFDDNTSTSYTALSSPWVNYTVSPTLNQQSIYVDLGKVYSLDQVELTFGTLYSPEYYIFVSSDAINWTEVHGTVFGTTGLNTINF